jgi:ribosome-binding protein aMBF1 (putative translation factor)
MDDEAKQIRKDLDRLTKRFTGEKGEPLSKEELSKKLDEAKAWVAIIEESQTTREKYGKKLTTDFQLRGGNDAASARVAIDDLEEEVYGSFIGALRKRIENVERALKEQGGTQK